MLCVFCEFTTISKSFVLYGIDGRVYISEVSIPIPWCNQSRVASQQKNRFCSCICLISFHSINKKHTLTCQLTSDIPQGFPWCWWSLLLVAVQQNMLTIVMPARFGVLHHSMSKRRVVFGQYVPRRQDLPCSTMLSFSGQRAAWELACWFSDLIIAVHCRFISANLHVFDLNS